MARKSNKSTKANATKKTRRRPHDDDALEISMSDSGTDVPDEMIGHVAAPAPGRVRPKRERPKRERPKRERPKRERPKRETPKREAPDSGLPGVDSGWEDYLPQGILSADLTVQSDRIFSGESPTRVKDRRGIVCLDTRGERSEDIGIWLDAFAMHWFEQSEQPSNIYQPLLVVVCDNDANLRPQIDDSFDVHIIPTTAGRETSAEDVYRRHLLKSYNSLISAPPTEDTPLPEHLHRVDPEQSMTADELKVWNEEQERTSRMMKRLLKE